MFKRSRTNVDALAAYAAAQSQQVDDNLHTAAHSLYSDTYLAAPTRRTCYPLSHPIRGTANNQRLVDALSVESIHIRYWIVNSDSDPADWWCPCFRLVYETGTRYAVPAFTDIFEGPALDPLRFVDEQSHPGNFQELWYKVLPMAGSVRGGPTIYVTPPPDPVEQYVAANNEKTVYAGERLISGLDLPQQYLEDHPGGWSTAHGGLYFVWSDAGQTAQHSIYLNIRVKYKESK